jgi:iduronate 2-sulfatase
MKSLLLVLLLSAFCLAAAPAPPTTRPNILFVISDDLTTTALGCYGNTVCKTPNIDKLAGMGVRFERAYCQWPLCWPSRGSFLSGQRPDARFARVDLLRKEMPDVEYWPEHFRKNGYFTARVGKIFHCRTVFNGTISYEDPACWDVSELGGTATDPCGYGVLFADHPKGLAAHPEVAAVVDHHELLNKAGNPAYDYWLDMAAVNLPDEQCTDGAIAARITQLLDEHAEVPEKPFLLAAGFRRPHLLWVAPKPYFDKYDWHRIELPNEPPEHVKDIPPMAFTRRSPDMTDEQRKKAIASYYACVSEVDDNVGKLMAAMDRLKLWDNTIVIFTADHGWHLDEHGGLWGKVTLFEEAAKVPLIIVAPGMSHGATSPRVCEMLDFYPTLCEMTGLSVPPKIDGTSIVPQLRDPSAPREKPAYSVLRRGKQWGRSVYTEQFRYTEWGDNGAKGFELYDHRTDPKEYHNLAHDPSQAETMKQLKALLDREVKNRDTDGPGDGAGTD